MSRRAIAVTNAASSPAPRRQRDAGAHSPAGSPSRLANEASGHRETDPTHPVELVTIAATPDPASSSLTVPSACL
jgi:hypothetical protein